MVSQTPEINSSLWSQMAAPTGSPGLSPATQIVMTGVSPDVAAKLRETVVAGQGVSSQMGVIDVAQKIRVSIIYNCTISNL